MHYNGEFTAYVWDNASTVGAAVWGGGCGGPSHCCIRWGQRSPTGREGFGGFFSIFTMGNAIASPTVKRFRFVCENFTAFSVRQTYCWKARFVGFLVIYSVSRSNLGLWEASKNATTVLRNLRSTQQGCRRNMFHEWRSRPLLVLATAHRDAARSQITLSRLVNHCFRSFRETMRRAYLVYFIK